MARWPGRRGRALTLAALVMLLCAPAGAASADPAEAAVRSGTEVAGVRSPTATLSAQWSRVRVRRSDVALEGANAAGAVSWVRGRLSVPGPLPRGRVCVTRRYTLEAAAQPLVGRFSHTVWVRRSGHRQPLWEDGEPYQGSPAGLRYVVIRQVELPVPRLRSGDRMGWTFAVRFDVAVTEYAETVRVERGRCVG